MRGAGGGLEAAAEVDLAAELALGAVVDEEEVGVVALELGAPAGAPVLDGELGQVPGVAPGAGGGEGVPALDGAPGRDGDERDVASCAMVRPACRGFGGEGIAASSEPEKLLQTTSRSLLQANAETEVGSDPDQTLGKSRVAQSLPFCIALACSVWGRSPTRLMIPALVPAARETVCQCFWLTAYQESPREGGT